MDKKKKVVILSDYPLSKTGFARNNRLLLNYLYATDKYDLHNIAVGTVDTQLGQEINRLPWKTYPAINAQNFENIKRQNDPRNIPSLEQMAGYGSFEIDKLVREIKPSVLIAIQDFWGCDFICDKTWFNKIPCAIWTTLDSLPILPRAVELAPKIKNFWSWADFATQAMHKLGHKHVQTLRGAVDTKNFFRLPNHKRQELRKRFNISEDCFVVGYVFRNQLRKSVPNVLEGFKLFKKENPKVNTKLIFHCNWNEGWNIQRQMKEYGINQDEVLTTYVCRSCRDYLIKPFTGNDLDCPHCQAQKTMTTTHPSIGVTEEQLNEVYNLMDCHLSAFTSGGQELTIQESKLTEIITLVTNYSCGEDSNVPEAGSLHLEFATYKEPGTEFIKASTYPTSICKQLTKVYNMDPQTRQKMGKQGRQWVLNNFSIDKIGKFIENFIDAAPHAKTGNENYIPSQELNDEKWLKETYKGFIGQEIPENEIIELNKNVL